MTELVTSGSVGGMASNGRLYPEFCLYSCHKQDLTLYHVKAVDEDSLQVLLPAAPDLLLRHDADSIFVVDLQHYS